MLTHLSGLTAHGSHYYSFMLVYRALVPLQKTQKVWKSTLTAKSSFVLAYRALVPLYKTQNQIHPAPQAKILRICISKCKILPAPQAKILRICTSKCKILPAPQAKIFADLHFSNAKSYRESAYLTCQNPKKSRTPAYTFSSLI